MLRSLKVEVTISGITTIGKCESCPYAELNDDSLTVITIRRKEEGLEVWNKGALYVTVNDPNMKDDDIEKVQVS
ncbi:hypothetical protein AB6A40_007669 [Gnathostoma spinigerum]|uniref:Uncharacterized protein n=1 Tax=Gnathostoma spinigerum TaxID=75299 RepID=A0ABD6ELW9_9BILA